MVYTTVILLRCIECGTTRETIISAGEIVQHSNLCLGCEKMTGSDMKVIKGA